MSSKINVFSVVHQHFSTLRDARTNKTDALDVFTFFLLPIALALFSAAKNYSFSDDVIILLVTAGSIFTGLLLNLLVLVYDQKTKMPKVVQTEGNWQQIQARHTALQELYYNISYSTVVALLIISFAILNIVFKNISPSVLGYEINLTGRMISPILCFLGFNLLLTILMVIKRFYVLLTTQDT